MCKIHAKLDSSTDIQTDFFLLVRNLDRLKTSQFTALLIVALCLSHFNVLR